MDIGIDEEDCKAIGCQSMPACTRKINQNAGNDCFSHCCIFCNLTCPSKKIFIESRDQFKLMIFRGKYAKKENCQ
jgi:hypothetical protein